MPLALDHFPPAHCSEYSTTSQEAASRTRAYDATMVPISELSDGVTGYPLRRSLVGQFYATLRELHVDGLSPRFVGVGERLEVARADLELKIHARVQQLLGMRPFEMDAADRRDSDVLNRIIDLTVYRNTSPIIVRQFGEVLYEQTSYPRAIRWDNGYKESVALTQVRNPDFVTFAPYQPIEAWVVRDPLTREILYITSVVKTARLRSANEIQQSGFGERIRSSNDLPDFTADE